MKKEKKEEDKEKAAKKMIIDQIEIALNMLTDQFDKTAKLWNVESIPLSHIHESKKVLLSSLNEGIK